jgi:restriction system protein
MENIMLLLMGIAGAGILIWAWWSAGAPERKKKQEEEERNIRRQKRELQLEELKNTDLEAYFKGKLEDELNNHIYNDILVGGYCCSANVEIVLSNRILGCDCRMPSKEQVGRVKEVYYLKNGERREKTWSDREFPKIYEGYLYAICIKAIDYLFQIDDGGSIDEILFNGYIFDYSPTTGHLEAKTIMSILVDRSTFESIDVKHVDPKACFKAFKGVAATKLYDVTPIVPILSLEKKDHRFIDSRDISVNEGTNLAAMDWEDFEQFVRELFQQEFGENGGEVKVTQASRDGGVDAIIFDPDPLRGGKIIVQAKRYTNTVPVSAVRDLYGTVINEGANSGILITTSDYGSDSYDFAKDKPLKLLNGGHLLGLLERHGHKAYIDIAEAKKIQEKV